MAGVVTVKQTTWVQSLANFVHFVVPFILLNSPIRQELSKTRKDYEDYLTRQHID